MILGCTSICTAVCVPATPAVKPVIVPAALVPVILLTNAGSIVSDNCEPLCAVAETGNTYLL